MIAARLARVTAILALAASLPGCGASSEEESVPLEGRGIRYWDGTKMLGYEFHVYLEPRGDLTSLTRVAIVSDLWSGEVSGECAVDVDENARPSTYGLSDSRPATHLYFRAGPSPGPDQGSINSLRASGGEGCTFTLPTAMPKGGLGERGVMFRLEGRLADGRRWHAEVE